MQTEYVVGRDAAITMTSMQQNDVKILWTQEPEIDCKKKKNTG